MEHIKAKPLRRDSKVIQALLRNAKQEIWRFRRSGKETKIQEKLSEPLQMTVRAISKSKQDQNPIVNIQIPTAREKKTPTKPAAWIEVPPVAMSLPQLTPQASSKFSLEPLHMSPTFSKPTIVPQPKPSSKSPIRLKSSSQVEKTKLQKAFRTERSMVDIVKGFYSRDPSAKDQAARHQVNPQRQLEGLPFFPSQSKEHLMTEAATELQTSLQVKNMNSHQMYIKHVLYSAKNAQRASKVAMEDVKRKLLISRNHAHRVMTYKQKQRSKSRDKTPSPSQLLLEKKRKQIGPTFIPNSDIGNVVANPHVKQLKMRMQKARRSESSLYLPNEQSPMQVQVTEDKIEPPLSKVFIVQAKTIQQPQRQTPLKAQPVKLFPSPFPQRKTDQQSQGSTTTFKKAQKYTILVNQLRHASPEARRGHNKSISGENSSLRRSDSRHIRKSSSILTKHLPNKQSQQLTASSGFFVEGLQITDAARIQNSQDQPARGDNISN